MTNVPYIANGVKTTFYGRDAQGNHLVTYDHHWNPNTSNEHFLLDERIMYGSNRLGLQDFNDSIYGPEDVPPVLDYYERNLGRKKYEGTNHLGNVLAVYSDKKLPKDDITPGGPMDYYEADIHGAYDYYSFGSPMPDRTFVPEACSTQTLVINNYTYQDNFPNPAPLWNPINTAVIGWTGPGSMTVNCNVPNDGVQQILPCVPAVSNVVDITFTYGNNDILIILLDPLTMLPLPGYPILYPAAMAGTVQTVQLFFNGPPSGNVLVQIISPGGPFPYPDMFFVNYVAISTQSTLQQQVCWDEDYRFGFNGMEKDNEAKGQGNSHTTRFRQYDPRLGRWFSIDPERQKYYDLSPYTAMANNPVNAIDINGDTIIITGSVPFQTQTLADLQKLTNDKLAIDASTGMVKIVSLGTENKGKNLSTGTTMIQELNKKGQPSTRLTTIRETTSGNSESDVTPADALNGVGSSTNVNYNPTSSPSILTEDPSTGNVADATRPAEIGLGHELVHAYRSVKGIAVDYSTNASHTYQTGTGTTATQTVPLEELETVGLKGTNKVNENAIRKEQGLNKRGGY